LLPTPKGGIPSLEKVPGVVGTNEPHHILFWDRERGGDEVEILIQGDNAFNMKVLDAETGESIKRVIKVELEITSTSSVAKLHVRNPIVDIRTKAEEVPVELKTEE
jgi:hypothetical protein